MTDLPVDRPLCARTAPGNPVPLRVWLKSWRGSSRLHAWGGGATRRALRLDQQPEFRGPAGHRVAHASCQPRHGGGGGAGGRDRRCARLVGAPARDPLPVPLQAGRSPGDHAARVRPAALDHLHLDRMRAGEGAAGLDAVDLAEEILAPVVRILELHVVCRVLGLGASGLRIGPALLLAGYREQDKQECSQPPVYEPTVVPMCARTRRSREGVLPISRRDGGRRCLRGTPPPADLRATPG